mmetsp:Transcript_14481/g.44097  ORF Transcript_14481/g.44097 Transcript_14481/m.44097 type:complete len:274 (-) Transcript_14481:443-1264(-)
MSCCVRSRPKGATSTSMTCCARRGRQQRTRVMMLLMPAVPPIPVMTRRNHCTRTSCGQPQAGEELGARLPHGRRLLAERHLRVAAHPIPPPSPPPSLSPSPSPSPLRSRNPRLRPLPSQGPPHLSPKQLQTLSPLTPSQRSSSLSRLLSLKQQASLSPALKSPVLSHFRRRALPSRPIWSPHPSPHPKPRRALSSPGPLRRRLARLLRGPQARALRWSRRSWPSVCRTSSTCAPTLSCAPSCLPSSQTSCRPSLSTCTPLQQRGSRAPTCPRS